MLRVASLSFILRAGVKCTPATNTSKSSSYRTIQATIDTILYERLKLAERDLFHMLQRLVFRSAGYLNREQVYPVALVFWLLLRMLCLGASHLSNLAERFRTKGLSPSLPPSPSHPTSTNTPPQPANKQPTNSTPSNSSSQRTSRSSAHRTRSSSISTTNYTKISSATTRSSLSWRSRCGRWC